MKIFTIRVILDISLLQLITGYLQQFSLDILKHVAKC